MKRLALLILPMALASCEHKGDGFVARVYTQSGQTMPYRLFIPSKYKKSG